MHLLRYFRSHFYFLLNSILQELTENVKSTTIKDTIDSTFIPYGRRFSPTYRSNIYYVLIHSLVSLYSVLIHSLVALTTLMYLFIVNPNVCIHSFTLIFACNTFIIYFCKNYSSQRRILLEILKGIMVESFFNRAFLENLRRIFETDPVRSNILSF